MLRDFLQYFIVSAVHNLYLDFPLKLSEIYFNIMKIFASNILFGGIHTRVHRQRQVDTRIHLRSLLQVPVSVWAGMGALPQFDQLFSNLSLVFSKCFHFFLTV